MVTILDGPVGTELARRGVPTPLPLWSAHALRVAPDVLAQIHRDYAAAGATVHTANTFRTSAWSLRKAGLEAEAGPLTRAAIAIARDAVPAGHRVAGCLAPLEDCYRPDLSPPASIALPEHAAMAELLADAGADLLLCETFPHPGEALAAVRAAVATGLPTWLSLTAGPTGDLLDDATLRAAAEQAVAAGAAAVLVNCMRPDRLLAAVGVLADLPVPIGAYGNVGVPCPDQGWRTEGDDEPGPYGQKALDWVDAGASIVGGCCGTTPAHVAAVAAAVTGRRAPA